MTHLAAEPWRVNTVLLYSVCTVSVLLYYCTVSVLLDQADTRTCGVIWTLLMPGWVSACYRCN